MFPWSSEPSTSDFKPLVWLVGGTRPEAIKLAPVATAISKQRRLKAHIVVTGQHDSLMDQALEAFGLRPDDRLRPLRTNGGQAELLSQLVTYLDVLAAKHPPAAILVQGDTTSALAGAMVGFWREIPVVHLEAGLRSWNLSAPFPEEYNRRVIAHSSVLHLAPTPAAAANLINSGICTDSVLVTGNTAVDAILHASSSPVGFTNPSVEALVRAARKGCLRLILATAHRRESWGPPLRRILQAVHELISHHSDLHVVFPVHPNPLVRVEVERSLGGVDRVLVTEPMSYPELASVLASSVLVLSDSGGIQEEAPSFGVPVLVLRDSTERGEAVLAGCATIVGTQTDRIVAEASAGLARQLDKTPRPNPFGDGRAAERVEQALAWLLGQAAQRPAPFVPTVANDQLV
ncbi:non-hydrolyzing UDP-N-acetylglucosamine 2-epimerase [Salinispora cortesiana]|uniref:non-hydrolyzing UDP-N-acetylglucosamine 2-epimerase n=1 Tax=Salinispora cortesiana TaxID=1305843 RepID=UPI00067E9928|nr:UDP-N-acetylglucosamine 2-epimerase (non-hydrolyzing) [Salinispora cortesiana]